MIRKKKPKKTFYSYQKDNNSDIMCSNKFCDVIVNELKLFIQSSRDELEGSIEIIVF